MERVMHMVMRPRTVAAVVGAIACSLVAAGCSAPPAAQSREDATPAVGLLTALHAGGQPAAAPARSTSVPGPQRMLRGGVGASSGSTAQGAPAAAQRAFSCPEPAQADRDAAPDVSGSASDGQPSPDFTATGFCGAGVELDPLIKGKRAMINFFASWCTECHNEAAAVAAAFRDYGASMNFQLVGVDEADSWSPGRQYYLSWSNGAFPAVYDPSTSGSRSDGKIGNAFQVSNAIPVSVFVRRDGTVDTIHYGVMTEQQISAELQRL